MHKTNCMQSIENISISEVFSSICPQAVSYCTHSSVYGVFWSSGWVVDCNIDFI